MEPPPDILYQYLSEPKGPSPDPSDIIRNCQLKLSTIGSLNDPFDQIPSLPERVRPEEIKEYLTKTIGRFGNYRRVTPALIAEVKSNLESAGSNPFVWWPQMARNARLICTSSRDDGVLLWSHYASRHRGFAVGFKTAVLAEVSRWLLFFEVRYRNERINLNVSDFIVTDYAFQVMHSLYSRKSPEWEYEKEWRAMPHTKDLADPAFQPFPPEAIDSIVLGPQMTREGEALLKSACESKGLIGRVDIKRGYLSRERFEIEVREDHWRV